MTHRIARDDLGPVQLNALRNGPFTIGWDFNDCRPVKLLLCHMLLVYGSISLWKNPGLWRHFLYRSDQLVVSPFIRHSKVGLRWSTWLGLPKRGELLLLRMPTLFARNRRQRWHRRSILNHITRTNRRRLYLLVTLQTFTWIHVLNIKLMTEFNIKNKN